jgi:hypothetical protein
MTDQQMSHQESASMDDEISLWEIIDFFKEGWKSLLIGSFVFGLIGISCSFITPPKFEVIANIQVAKVSNIEVEAPATLAEKLKFPSYYTDNTITVCKLNEFQLPREELVSRLKPALIKNTSIISITYKALTVETAKACIEAVIRDIRSYQAELADPIIDLKKIQLLALQNKAEDIERVMKLFSSTKDLNFDITDSKFSASALLLSTVLSKENEIKDLRASIRDLEFSLSEPQTKSAFLVTPIYSSGLKVEPKSTLITLGSIFAGFILVTGYLLMRKIWRAEVRKKQGMTKF